MSCPGTGKKDYFPFEIGQNSDAMGAGRWIVDENVAETKCLKSTLHHKTS